MKKTDLEDFIFYENAMEHLTSQQRKKIPVWAKTVAVSADGVIYMPAAMAGSENEVMLCAGYDGTEGLIYMEHVYYPTNWMAKEFPKLLKTVQNIEQTIQRMRMQ